MYHTMLLSRTKCTRPYYAATRIHRLVRGDEQIVEALSLFCKLLISACWNGAQPSWPISPSPVGGHIDVIESLCVILADVSFGNLRRIGPDPTLIMDILQACWGL